MCGNGFQGCGIMENEIKLIWKEFNDMGPLSGYSQFNMEVCAVKKRYQKFIQLLG